MRQPSDISHPHSYCLGKGQQILWNECVTNAIAYLTAMEQRKMGAKPAPCYHQLPLLRFGNWWYHHLVANQMPQTPARHLRLCTSTAPLLPSPFQPLLPSMALTLCVGRHSAHPAARRVTHGGLGQTNINKTSILSPAVRQHSTVLLLLPSALQPVALTTEVSHVPGPHSRNPRNTPQSVLRCQSSLRESCDQVAAFVISCGEATLQ